MTSLQNVKVFDVFFFFSKYFHFSVEFFDVCSSSIRSVDAVYAMAHAVHRMIIDVCGPDARELCDELKPAPSGRNLLKYIRNVNFIGTIFLTFNPSKYI